MSLITLLIALILLCLGIYLLRMLVADATIQRVCIAVLVVVFVLWLLQGFAVFDVSFFPHHYHHLD